MGKKENLVIAVYSHPEYLPPTLNAIEHLSEQYEKIFVVHRNVHGFDWKYPANVTLLHSGNLLSVREAETKSLFSKVKMFLAFSILLCKTFNKSKSTALLFYDYLPLLSYRIMRIFMPKPAMIWYHNHDVAESQYIRKYSIAWWAWKSEKWIFPRLTIFSLPALERKVCFPMDTFRGTFFFLPNFPSKKAYKDFVPKPIHDVIRILYQGSIGTEHGLEEIISLLNTTINGKEINLVIKGFISAEYKMQLKKSADEQGVWSKIVFVGPTGYREVIENAYTCHIGIGIHKKKDFMNKTLGTASNKIYEYAAAGLPVLLYNNGHFREHLQQFEWAFFTDCSRQSLIECISSICSDYKRLSAKARADFENNLNFELNYEKVSSSLYGDSNKNLSENK